MTGPLYAAQNPAAPLEVATMGYVESVIAGLNAKEAVQAGTAAALPAYTATPLTLTANFTGALTIDTVTPALGDRVLVKNEVAAANNGIYVLSQLGTSMEPWILTRSSDMDTAVEVPGAYTFVQMGSANAGFGYIVEGTGPVTLGTTAINWEQFTSTGEFYAGTGLTLSGQEIYLNTPVTIADGGTGAGTGAPAAQNDVFAGPAAGGAGSPSFRPLAAGDLPAATTGAQGAVQLAGDLGGTAASPQVLEIQGRVISSPPTGGAETTDFLRGDGTWAAPPGSGVDLAGDLGNTASVPEVISTHLASPLPVAQGGTAVSTPTVFNVMAYGALGNGSHDDSAAWQAALAAAIAAGTSEKGNGGTVLFPPGGHYMVSEMDFSSAATGRVAIHVVADGAVIECNNAAGGVFVNFSGVAGTAALEYCSFTGATLYPKQSSSNPTTDLVYITVASYNTLSVTVFDPGMLASPSGSAVHFYGRSGSGCYYNTISLRCAPQPGSTGSYGGNGLTLDGWDAGGPYLQSNAFPAVVCVRAAGIGINDLGSGVNVFTEADCEYNTGYGLVVNTESQGLRFLNFYMEGNNGITGDQWSIPTGSANAGTSVFMGNLSVTPTDADRSYWAYYQDNAYGGVQSHAGTRYSYGSGTEYPVFYAPATDNALGVRQLGDTADRFAVNFQASALPAVLMSMNGTSTFIALEITATTATPAVGPGSDCAWKPYGGEAYRYTTQTNATSPPSSPYRVQNFDRAVIADATAGTVALDLPSGQTPDGTIHMFKKTDATANTVTITPIGGTYTIDGAASYTLSTQWQSVEMMFNNANSNWDTISKAGPASGVTLDATAADIQAGGTQQASTGASVGDAADSTHVHPENAAAIFSDYTAGTSPLLAWNYDIALAGITGSATFTANPAAGTLYLARVNIRQAITPAKVVILNSAPSGGESGYYLALFSSAGTQLGSTSADQSGVSSGLISVAVGTPGTLAAGSYVYVALLIVTQGSTKGGASYLPQISVAPCQYDGGTTSAYRWAVNGTGLGAMPGSLTLSSNTNSGSTAYAFWCGLQ